MEEKKKILIVEDERAIVEILKFNLAREGYETLEALDGEAGLQLGLTGDVFRHAERAGCRPDAEGI